MLLLLLITNSWPMRTNLEDSTYNTMTSYDTDNEVEILLYSPGTKLNATKRLF